MGIAERTGIEIKKGIDMFDKIPKWELLNSRVQYLTDKITLMGHVLSCFQHEYSFLKYDYLVYFKCKHCGNIIQKTEEQLTPEEKKALVALKVIEEKK